MMSHSILLHCNENVEVSVTRKKQAIWRAHPGWTEQQFRVAWLKRKREIFYNLCNDDLDTTQQREGPGDPLPQAQATDQAGLVGGFLSGLSLDLADACRHSTSSAGFRRTSRLDGSSRLFQCLGTATANRHTSTTCRHRRRTNCRCSQAMTVFITTDLQPPFTRPDTTAVRRTGPRLAVARLTSTHNDFKVKSTSHRWTS